MVAMFENSTNFEMVWQTFIQTQRNLTETPLVLAKRGKAGKNFETYNPDKLRNNEKEFVESVRGFEAWYDLRPKNKMGAGLSIAMTVFVCFILASGALLFSNLATDMVITPIETMMEKVNRIAANPLLAAQEEENDALAIDEYEKEQKRLGKWKPKKKEAPMETVLLEQTITKIGALLALGFGEAGSKIIAQNMASSGDVNPMMAGHKIIGIYGFCDIRNFTDATECL
jgi:hypothetical protein